MRTSSPALKALTIFSFKGGFNFFGSAISPHTDKNKRPKFTKSYVNLRVENNKREAHPCSKNHIKLRLLHDIIFVAKNNKQSAKRWSKPQNT
jgi:hypothetical protein